MKLFDGNTATFFDWSDKNGAYAGLDFSNGTSVFPKNQTTSS